MGAGTTLLLAKASYPSVPDDVASQVSWLSLAVAVAVAVWALSRAEWIRRSLLSLEDPRTYAVLRAGFAVCTIVNFVNLQPYWRMLWSDEGIFTLFEAQERLGRSALRGWTEPDGFLDLFALGPFLWHKPSLFYITGSPDFVVGYMVVFFGVLILYGLGVFSRVTGVVAWLMMSGIYNRNALYWEGTDTVYRTFWFLLLFARTGHAWSFDNWWRCRRLRKQGRLRPPGAPADAPGEPIYRLVPAWPRYLMMAQLCAIYITTGMVKTGSVWARGDALYYALNMDHFYRFERLTQQVSAALGTTVFRFMTHVTLWWERLFPVVIVGLLIRFDLRTRELDWAKRMRSAWRIWLGRGAMAAGLVALWRLNVVAYPYCLALVDGDPKDPTAGLAKIDTAYVILGVVVAAWWALDRWPLAIPARKLGRVQVPRIPIDQRSVRDIMLGRRLWLSLGACFHGFLVLFMNIGMFPFIMLMTYACYFEGTAYAGLVRGVVSSLRARGRTLDGADVLWERAQPAPTSGAKIRGSRSRTLGEPVVWLFAAAAVGLVLAKMNGVDWVGTATKGWVGLAVVVAGIYRFLPSRPSGFRDRPHLAYGAVGRTLALGLVLWHGTAVASALFPNGYKAFRWRSVMRGIQGTWLRGTATNQSWNMFAPNPPRANVFLKTVVVEADGDRWDLRNNAFTYRPNPWIVNDRMRKMQRRMSDKGKWYLRYWAAYHCRDWALRTGEMPERIVITKLVTRIPGPKKVKRKGWYDPRRLKVKEHDLQEHKCAGRGELPAYMLERRGLPVPEAAAQRAADRVERDEKKWERRRTQWAKRKDWGAGWWTDESGGAAKSGEGSGGGN